MYKLTADEKRWELLAGTGGLRACEVIDLEPDGTLLATYGRSHAFRLQHGRPHELEAREAAQAGLLAAVYAGRTYAYVPRRLAGTGYSSGLKLPAHPIEIRGVVDDRNGTLWFNTRGGFFGTDAKGNWRHFRKADGLLQTSLQALGAAPDGSIWIGYDDPVGFSRLPPLGPNLPDKLLLRHFRPQSKSYSDGTFFFGFDRTGNVWRGTGGGVHISDGKRLDLPDWLVLNRHDGLPDNDTALKGFFLDRDGSVWISTILGVARFADPTAILRQRRAAAIIADQRWSTAKQDAARVSVAISLPGLTHRVKLEYRVLPDQPTWTAAASPDIELTHLHPGSHQVEARVVATRWIQSSGVALLQLDVPEGWPAIWWFSLVPLCALPAVLLRRNHRRREYQNAKQDYVAFKSALPMEREWHFRNLSPAAQQQLSSILAEAPAEQDASGELIAGRYFLEHRLGEGGFATVHFARDVECGREPVAVKLMRGVPGNGTWLAERWTTEQAALQRLAHPYIVQTRDAGIHPDWGPYLVTDYLEGVTLRAVLNK